MTVPDSTFKEMAAACFACDRCPRPDRRPPALAIDMPREAPGPWATLAIVAVTALVFFFDRRRRKRAEPLNQNGRCARCGTTLVESGHLVPISGGRLAWRGRVCGGCYAAVKLQERIVCSLIAAGLVAVLVLAWWSVHACLTPA